ncbi:MAG TPA: FlgD immunoglobulin-like domain containing protein, partial [Armatimonadota bacterium]|nr:FlgD immunoglobulin-like domain containing protein [Armatimonadota bacterium]
RLSADATRNNAPPAPSIDCTGSSGLTIQGNGIGVDNLGNPTGNGGMLLVSDCRDVTIGGPMFFAGNSIPAVTLSVCDSVDAQGNRIGFMGGPVNEVDDWGYTAPLQVLNSTNISIGGSARGEGNTITGDGGSLIEVNNSCGITIEGNDFPSLGPSDLIGNGGSVKISNGPGTIHTHVPGSDCIGIGGTKAGSGNVFMNSPGNAIVLCGEQARDIAIRRNFIGIDPATGKINPPGEGAIIVIDSAGRFTIGGNRRQYGNTIYGSANRDCIRIRSDRCGGSLIRWNRCYGPRGGIDGRYGISIIRPDALAPTKPLLVADNWIRRCGTGIYCSGRWARCNVRRNQLTLCHTLVGIFNGAKPNLGDASAGHEGGNVFRNATWWVIDNSTSNDIKAEGNEWGTTSGAAIAATIFDFHDNAALGTVDFDPLKGGVAPTGGTDGVVQLTSLTALPTAAGAEVVFSLSAPAQVAVEILNIAGRPVASLPPRDAEAGINRVTWNGLSNHGTAAPAGRYVVRALAATPEGDQAAALATLSLSR